MVAAALAHGKTAALADLGVAARALADGRTLGRGHSDASIDLGKLLVDLAFPLVVPPVRVPTPLPARTRSLVSSAWER